jgi:hypothetical protein
VLALVNNPNVDGVFTDDFAGFASEHDFAPINTNLSYADVGDLQYATLAVHGRLIDALAARGKLNWQAAGGGYQGEYPQQAVPRDADACTAYMRARCTPAFQQKPVIIQFDSFNRNQSIASFLIVRGPVAYIGSSQRAERPNPHARAHCKRSLTYFNRTSLFLTDAGMGMGKRVRESVGAGVRFPDRRAAGRLQ